jgi:TetR/AcrR family transcriptional regulator, cholesterol catabolism regulator
MSILIYAAAAARMTFNRMLGWYTRRLREQKLLHGYFRWRNIMGRPVKRKASPSTTARANGRSTATAETSTRRRAEIIATAASVFARKGVGNTTMRDIADEAGILAGSLYHHFESKDELLEEILRDVLGDLTEAYEEVRKADIDPVTAIKRLLLVGLQFVNDQHDVTSIVQNDYTYLHDMERFTFVDGLTELHRRSWRAVLDRGVAAGVFRDDVDLELVYRSMIAAIVAEVRWRRGNRRPPAEELAEQYSRLYLSGLVTAKPEQDNI